MAKYKIGDVNLGKSNWRISKEVIYTLGFVLFLDVLYPLMGFTSQETGVVLITIAVYLAGLIYVQSKTKKDSWKSQRIAKR